AERVGYHLEAVGGKGRGRHEVDGCEAGTVERKRHGTDLRQGSWRGPGVADGSSPLRDGARGVNNEPASRFGRVVVPESLAPELPGADGDLLARKLNAAEWLSLKSTIPARRLVIPGPHEGPALDHHDPHAGVTVLGPGADAEDLGLGQFLECRPWESSCSSHVLKRGRFAVEGPSAAKPAGQVCIYLI